MRSKALVASPTVDFSKSIDSPSGCGTSCAPSGGLISGVSDIVELVSIDLEERIAAPRHRWISERSLA
jgi:hypothetical protein